jgi:hypothetical protein
MDAGHLGMGAGDLDAAIGWFVEDLGAAAVKRLRVVGMSKNTDRE